MLGDKYFKEPKMEREMNKPAVVPRSAFRMTHLAVALFFLILSQLAAAQFETYAVNVKIKDGETALPFTASDVTASLILDGFGDDSSIVIDNYTGSNLFLQIDEEYNHNPKLRIEVHTQTITRWVKELNGNEITLNPVDNGTAIEEFVGTYNINAHVDQMEVTAHPVTGWDRPRSATPGGTALPWGPSGQAGGVMRLYSGEFTEHAVDLAVPGRGLDAVFSRRYLTGGSDESIVGNNWDFSYNIYAIDVTTTGIPGTISASFGNHRLVVYSDTGEIHSGGGLFNQRMYTKDAWPMLFGYNIGSAFGRWEDGTVWVFGDIYGSGGARNYVQSMRDRNGNTIQFSYDGNDTLTAITDTLGRQYALDYYDVSEDSSNVGKLQSITELDGLGRVITYEYYNLTNEMTDVGGIGDLRQVEYSGGSESRTVTYTYSTGTAGPEGALLTITDSRGNGILANTYNPSGQIIKQVLADGAAITYTYEEIAGGISIGLGAPTNTILEAARRTIVKDGVGIVTEYLFDDMNRTIAKRRYTGNAGIYEFVTSDKLDSLTGKVRSSDPVYYETKYAWNDHDDIKEMVDPGGVHEVYTYESDLATEPLKRGHVIGTSRYDVNAANPIVTSRTFTNFGTGGWAQGAEKLHLLQYDDVIDGGTLRTTYARDTNGNVTQVTYPDGSFENYTYYASGLQKGWIEEYTTALTVAGGSEGDRRTDRYDYTFTSTAAYMVTITQNDNVQGEPELVSTEDYDAAGRPVAATDPNGNTTSYTYDLFDQLLNVTAPAPGNGVTIGPKTTYQYDENNNLIRTTTNQIDEKGNGLLPIIATQTFDVMNRVTRSIDDAGGQAATTEYAYDLNGRMTTMRTPEAVAGTQKDNVVDYTYDERNLVHTSTRANTEITTYDYDFFGNVLKQVMPDTTKYLYTYDDFGRRETTLDPFNVLTTVVQRNDRGLIVEEKTEQTSDGSTVTALLSESSTVYDPRGRVSNIKVNADAIGTTYSYVPSGQIHEITDPLGRTTTHTYDIFERLDTVVDAKGNSEAYTYDDNGNVIAIARTDDHDSDANLDETHTTTFTYDNLNRRVSTTDLANHSTEVKYDSLGRVRRTVDAKGNTPPSTTITLAAISPAPITIVAAPCSPQPESTTISTTGSSAAPIRWATPRPMRTTS